MNSRTNSIEIPPGMFAPQQTYNPDTPKVLVARSTAVRFAPLQTWRQPHRYSIFRSSQDGVGEFWEMLSYGIIWFNALLAIGICFA
jgi:hypothetical protein